MKHNIERFPIDANRYNTDHNDIIANIETINNHLLKKLYSLREINSNSDITKSSLTRSEFNRLLKIDEISVSSDSFELDNEIPERFCCIMHEKDGAKNIFMFQILPKLKKYILFIKDIDK